ncbi:MAG: hypothetical protein JWQ87_3039 [Candidatus Sulfotelmatobacter sp.]|nr:hypothetical protein [Candidatus Sulfotelmatobacter sp.]
MALLQEYRYAGQRSRGEVNRRLADQSSRQFRRRGISRAFQYGPPGCGLAGQTSEVSSDGFSLLLRPHRYRGGVLDEMHLMQQKGDRPFARYLMASWAGDYGRRESGPPGARMTTFGDSARPICRRPILYCDGQPCLNEMGIAASHYCAFAGLPWITQLLLTNLVLIEVKEVPGQKLPLRQHHRSVELGGHVHECLRSP